MMFSIRTKTEKYTENIIIRSQNKPNFLNFSIINLTDIYIDYSSLPAGDCFYAHQAGRNNKLSRCWQAGATRI